MSMTVGELRAILTVDTEGFDRGVKRVHGELGETEKKSTRMGRSLRKVGGYAAAAFGGYQVLKFGKDIAQTAADTQNARLVLQGLYGDAHLADTTFAKLKQVAKGSPIDRSEYLKSADSLAYLGVKGDDAVTMIKRMTQAAIGSGRGREGVDQMIQGLTRLSSQGKATADVVDQISQGGFALWSALAKHMHMTIPQVHKAVSAGKVGMKQITDTIEHENNKWTRATARSAAKAEGSLKNRFAAAKNEVTDSIADMVEPLLVKLAPAVTAVANDLQGFVGFLTRHKTTVEGVAVGLGVLATEILAVKTATMIYNTRASLVRDATKAWAAAQRLLNLAMDANPMMLVISVVAMLVAAFITAYTTSKTFRKIVNGVFGAVASFVTGAISTVRKVVVGGFNWIKNHLGIILPIIAGIVFGPVGAIAVFIATHWSQIKRITGKVFGWVRDFIGTALGKAKSVALGAVRWIVDKFLWFAEKIVGAAARAFGWVPGLGGKLKSAERAIHAFRAKTNAELRAVDSTPAQREMHSLQRAIDHLRGRNINIRAHVGGGGVLRTLAKARQLALPKASGGSVQGPGTETSDSIPALLSRGEHVWSAREVRGAGGHAAVEAMRRHARGLASGGPVGVNVNMPSPHALTTEWARMVGSISHRLMDTLGSALSKAMSMFGGAGGPGPTSHGATVALGRRMAAAYGWTGGQWTALNKLWTRESSWNPHARNPSSGAFGIPQSLPASKMGPAAQAGNAAAQIRWGLDYIRRRYGSPGRAWAHELSAGWYDRGGVLKPGLTLAYNGTGADEMVVPQRLAAGGPVNKAMATYRQANTYGGTIAHLQALEKSWDAVGQAEHRTAKQRAQDARKARTDARIEALQAKQKLAQNKAAWQFDHATSQQQLAILNQRLKATKRFTDSWVQLAKQREQLLKQLADAQKQAADTAQQSYDTSLSNLNSLLDKRKDLLGQQAQAEQTYSKAVADAQRQLADATSQALDQRREAILSYTSLSERASIKWGNTAKALTSNVTAQTGQISAWTSGLDKLRKAGLSSQAIKALGLAESPSALGQVQQLLRATPRQIDALNDAVASRVAAGNAEVAREQTGMLGKLGDSLRQAQASYHSAVAQAEATFQSQMADAAKQLAALGQDQGRSYVDAIAEGMRSGIPGVVAAAKALQTARMALSEAQAAADAPVGSKLAQLKGELAADLGKLPALASKRDALRKTATAEHQQAYIKAVSAYGRLMGTIGNLEAKIDGLEHRSSFDLGGTLAPGWNTVYNGLGRPETLRPVASSGAGDVQVSIPITVVTESGDKLYEQVVRRAAGDNRTVLIRAGR